jgi:glycolate oxidase iron-sulfur subunit
MRAKVVSPLAGTIAGATAEAVLRACVHCGMCNATCPTFKLTGDELDGPRGRIYLMKSALEGEAVTRETQLHLDRCLTCRACETTCPSGVEYHRLLDIGRPFVDAQLTRPWRERALRALIRWVTPHADRFAVALALGRLFAPILPATLRAKLPPKAPAQAAAPKPAGGRRMALLAGCVQAAAAPQFNAAATRVFARIGADLAPTPGAGCCGAIDFHLGAADQARALARRNIDAWLGEARAEAVVVTASGCAAFIKDYPDLLAADPAYAEKAVRVAALVTDPVEVLAETPPRPVRPPAEPRIAVHEPCTLRHGLKLPGRIETLLAALGYQPQPVRDAHLCCGSAGSYALTQPEFAGALRADKLAALTEHAPAAIFTANIGCWLHLGETAPVPVRHWIEAVDEVT